MKFSSETRAEQSAMSVCGLWLCVGDGAGSVPSAAREPLAQAVPVAAGDMQLPETWDHLGADASAEVARKKLLQPLNIFGH